MAIHLWLHPFTNLSGAQVVELVRAVVARKMPQESGQAAPLALTLDISFLPSVRSAHIKRILELTRLEELVI